MKYFSIKNLLLIALGCSALICQASFAQTQSNPLLEAAKQINAQNNPDTSNNHGCVNQGFNFKSDRLVLNTDNNPLAQRIFILRNTTNYMVLLNHANPNPGTAGAGWGSRIGPGNASAIALTQRFFDLTCLAYSPPHIGAINCQNAIAVCAYPPQAKIVGDFWVGENVTPEKLQQIIQQRNVLP